MEITVLFMQLPIILTPYILSSAPRLAGCILDSLIYFLSGPIPFAPFLSTLTGPIIVASSPLARRIYGFRGCHRRHLVSITSSTLAMANIGTALLSLGNTAPQRLNLTTCHPTTPQHVSRVGESSLGYHLHFYATVKGNIGV